jgi:hypothetical protein
MSRLDKESGWEFTAVMLGSGGGALSYGLSLNTDFNFVTEVASGQSEIAGIAFAVAGTLSLAYWIGATDLGGEDD